MLKSNYANGLFGFDGPCQPLAASMIDTQFTCSVNRDKGTDDTVVVTWHITSLSSNVSDYFNVTTGILVFQPGQTHTVKNIHSFALMESHSQISLLVALIIAFYMKTCTKYSSAIFECVTCFFIFMCSLCLYETVVYLFHISRKN